MHSGEIKIANLIRKHLQTKEKTRMGGGRKGKGEEDGADLLSPPLRFVF
jgi:hypothetical protein